MEQEYDVIIIGTGAGGGTLAYGLKDSGLKILILERGDFMPQEPENWSSEAVFTQNRYKPKEFWYDQNGKAFTPGVNYAVGGATKIYGTVMMRLRKEDFEEVEHADGNISPAWPIKYEDLEPYYRKAEEIYKVHGNETEDPTEPPRSSKYPYPEVPHEPIIEDLANRLKKLGLNPSHLPLAVNYHDQGPCILCKTCDGFPCLIHAKGDSDICCIRPSLRSPNVKLITNAYARRILTNESGDKVTAVEYEKNNKTYLVKGKIIIVACGAVNSAALLLRSANEQHPNGLANQSGLVGRNYMMHNNSALIAVKLKRNTTSFQKTLHINDFYFGTEDFPYPMGNLQMLGKLQGNMLKQARPLIPKFLLNFLAERTIDWFVMSEDLPDPNNRVIVNENGNIQINWKPNNLKAHKKLLSKAKQMLRKAGFPIVASYSMVSVGTNSHQCGTVRFGNDPNTSVLNSYCRAHTVENLYVVDASFFPSSGAVNPALTVAAQALRVADHIKENMKLNNNYNEGVLMNE